MIKHSIGKNNEDVSKMNTAVILRYLHHHGICTRAQVSKAIGLTQAAISKTVSVLINKGIVEETGYIAGNMGRRSIGISINPHCKKIFGVRLSRRSFSVGAFDISGRKYDTVSESFLADSSLKEVISRIKEILHGLLLKYPDTAAIGVAVPGPFNVKTGEIILTTSMATADWTHIKLKKEFSGEFDIPVVIKHDANAGAMADWWLGNQMADIDGTLVHFLVGDGVGAGIISKSAVFEGKSGFSGEIGHVSIDVNGPRCRCGNFGCLEMYCSTFAFVENAKKALLNNKNSALSRIPVLTPESIIETAYAGDELAKDLLIEEGQYIGYGVSMLINIYNPDVIVISNRMAKGGEILLESVKKTARERIFDDAFEDVSILLEDEQLMDDPILYGAAVVAIAHCLKEPFTLSADKPVAQIV